MSSLTSVDELSNGSFQHVRRGIAGKWDFALRMAAILPFSGRAARIGGLQAPKQLASLNDLLQQAEHYAEFCMRNSGRMSPTLFLIGAEDPLMFVPESLADEDEKDSFATTARLLCIALAATAVVMTMEAWMKTAQPEETLDLTEPPSEAFDRQEVVLLMGEARTGQQQKYLPIIRSGNGKFFGFGELDMPEVDTVEGRFARILPAQPPTKEYRAVAKLMLEVKGVRLDKAGTTVSLKRFRR